MERDEVAPPAGPLFLPPRIPVRIDFLVVLCTLIWGCNYAVVKIGLREIPPLGFNALRLSIASVLFLTVLAFARPEAAGHGGRPAGGRFFRSARTIPLRDWLAILALGAIGHFIYQLGFIGGLELTTVANSSLIIGCSPVVVTALAVAVGQERVSTRYWLGAALSLVGVYLVVGAGAGVSRDSLVGDLVTLGAVCCWAVYVIWSRALMQRHSPLVVTGYTMTVGTLMYLPFGYPSLAALDWGGVSAVAWSALVASAVFALFVAYLIWHTSIQRIGNIRTAMYLEPHADPRAGDGRALPRRPRGAARDGGRGRDPGWCRRCPPDLDRARQPAGRGVGACRSCRDAATGTKPPARIVSLPAEVACSSTVSRDNLSRGGIMRNCAFGLLLAAAFAFLVVPGEAAKKYTYYRVGSASDVGTATTGGTVLMGGGTDVDAAFQWMCGKAGNGDVLVIRTTGTDAYNPYILDLCPGVNSVATLIVPTTSGANDPFVANAVRSAEAIFIAGGDQSTYIINWKGTLLQTELNAAIARGVPVGGTSAGLMVLTQFVYSALLSQGVTSSQALADPFTKYITLDRDFVGIPTLVNTIGDAHFVTRDRMGRELAFMCRVAANGWTQLPKGIAVDEQTAVLVDTSGSASVVGTGTAYFLAALGPAAVCQPKKPLTYGNVGVYRIRAGGTFNLDRWVGSGGTSYSVSATAGVLSSTQLGGSVY